jgi:hypothetical protein
LRGEWLTELCEDIEITKNALQKGQLIQNRTYADRLLKTHKFLLTEYPKPFTVAEIARKTEFSSPTISNHLEILRSEKKVMKVLVLGSKMEILWVAWIPPNLDDFTPDIACY